MCIKGLKQMETFLPKENFKGFGLIEMFSDHEINFFTWLNSQQLSAENVGFLSNLI